MAIKKSKTDEQELAQAKSINSLDDSANNQNVLIIKYLNEQDKDEINGIYAGQDLWLIAELSPDKRWEDYTYTWNINRGEFKGAYKWSIDNGVFNQSKLILVNDRSIVEGQNILITAKGGYIVCIATNAVKTVDAVANKINVNVKAERGADPPIFALRFPPVDVREPSKSDLKGNFDSKVDSLREGIDNLRYGIKSGVPISLQRTSVTPTPDIALWVVIRKSTNDISFRNYANFMDAVLNPAKNNGDEAAQQAGDIDLAYYKKLRQRRFLPFNDTDAYRTLKVATEAFLLVNSGVPLSSFAFEDADIMDLNSRLGGAALDDTTIQNFWTGYLVKTIGGDDPTLPYLAIIGDKLGGGPLRDEIFENEYLNPQNTRRSMGILRRKLTSPFLFELIWSYWHEEGMLVQTMNAIARRFQNMRSPHGARDPLAGLEIDTLRSLSNLLWGYVQDEQHRLSLVRRVYEYDHHYGISLQGKAVPKLRSADSRSKFIEAFHHLLHLCSIYFKQDDDTTVIGDGFPLLNGLKEVHLVLSQGAHNQFGDLPSTARQEMLIQQWILARPEFREFLPTRHAVAYGDEPWMDRVEAMKSLQGWTDTSIIHFHNLAVFGEQLLLSIRYGNWSISTQSPEAANWARYWRGEIQGYIHAYRAVTGVDLSSASSDKIDSTPPSVHLFNRYMAQARRY